MMYFWHPRVVLCTAGCTDAEMAVAATFIATPKEDEH